MLAEQERVVVRGLFAAFVTVVAVIATTATWWVTGGSLTSIATTAFAIAALVAVARHR